MELVKNRKAIFYTLLAFVFIMLVLVISEIFYKPQKTELQETVLERIITFNDFLNNIEKDLERLCRITGFRSFLAMEDYVASNGVFLNNTGQAFEEAFTYGTINNIKMDIMENSSLKYYLTKITDKASDIGLWLNIRVINISLEQVDAWNVKVTLLLNINASDKANPPIATWEYNTTAKARFSIIGLRDPLYSVNTAGKVDNTIQQTNITEFVGDDNSTDGLLFHITNGLYKNSTKAPSFLMRFTNNLSNSDYGIESLVYIPLINAQNIPIDESKSVVDYLFFSNQTNTADLCYFTNMPDWFRIDSDHEEDYDLDKLNSSSC